MGAFPAKVVNANSSHLHYAYPNHFKPHTMKTSNCLRLVSAAAFCAGLVLPRIASASELQLVIKDHQFLPAEIKAPAGQKLRLVVHNQDSTPEEFESHALKREKIIAGNSKATILLGPLKPGRYTFFGEFNPATAQGTLVIE